MRKKTGVIGMNLPQNAGYFYLQLGDHGVAR
jgi:hypothetical protein